MDKKESLMARRHGMRRYLTGLGIAISSALVAGCATTTGGGQNMPPQIPEGKGHLILDAGGIKEMNFFVISQETEQQVFSYMPRASAMSPSAYERSAQEFGLHTYLDPGIYTVVVNTDLEADTIEIPDVEVKLGEEKWVRVQVGRFMLNVTSFQTNKLAGALTLSVCGNVKQILTVILGIVLFKINVRPMNAVGMAIALGGAAWYSKVELDVKRASARS